MALPPPDWATPEEVHEYGAYYLNMFCSRAHYEHHRATGRLTTPKSERAKARLHADPVKLQRERLRASVYTARRAIERTKQRITDAQAALAEAHNFWRFRDEEALQRAQEQLPGYVLALERAEREFELFTLLHSADTKGTQVDSAAALQ